MEWRSTHHAQDIPCYEKRESPADAPTVRVMLVLRRNGTPRVFQSADGSQSEKKKKTIREKREKNARSLIMHVLVPALAEVKKVRVGKSYSIYYCTHPEVMNASMTSALPIVE